VQSKKVQFGATVTFQNEEGLRKKVYIVGIDETDPAIGKISWISPLAKALLNHESGDLSVLKSPKGEEDLEIIRVEYLEVP
jgi:transcription elongation factor GreB